MKIRPWQFFGLLLVLTTLAPAQDVRPAPLLPAHSSSAQLSPEQLDELLGPIALYPDALIAIMLPASTSPSEIVLAARYLQDGRNAQQIDQQPWDDSVRALAHYPDTIRWMDENLAWTKQLGEVFLAQSDDVMSAIQRLRARALSAGSLFTNAQQQVVTEAGLISILPAQPHVIYAPYYSPQIVYFSRVGYSSFNEPFLSFGTGFSSGWWLAYHLDWGQRRIWVVDRHARERHWQEHRDLRPGLPPPPGRPGFVGPPPWQTWHPSPHHARPPRPADVGTRTQIVIVQPAPYSGAPRFHRPPPNLASPRPEPRPRLATAETPGRAPGTERARERPNVPPVTTFSPPAVGSTEPSPAPPPRRTRAPANAPSTPSPNPAPASSTLTFNPTPAPAPTAASPTPPPARPSAARSDQPGRNRSTREDRPVNPERTTTEASPRTRSSFPPTPPQNQPVAAPATGSRATPPPPAATPPAATSRSTPPPAETEDRRNRKPDEQPR